MARFYRCTGPGCPDGWGCLLSDLNDWGCDAAYCPIDGKRCNWTEIGENDSDLERWMV